MNRSALWQQLHDHGMVNQAEPPVSTVKQDLPWYIMVIHGFSGWLAAFFLLAFFASAFGFLFVQATSFIAIAAGLICSTVAYAIFRSQLSTFVFHLALAISLCGQLMVATGLFFMTQLDIGVSFYLLAAYQLLLSVLIHQFSHRFITAFFGLISLLLALNVNGFYAVGSAILSVVFSIIWIRESRWGHLRPMLLPIGLAIAVVLVFSSGFFLSERSLLGTWVSAPSSWLFAHAPIISSAFVAMVCANVVLLLLKENNIDLLSTTGALSLVAIFGLIAISFWIVGLSTGLLIVLIGFARQRNTLLVLGILATVGFFSWYYYQLDQTLLFKSFVLMALALALLLSWFVIKYLYPVSVQHVGTGFHFRPIWRHGMAGVTVLVVLILININIVQKQQLIANGETLYLRLAPVDPRSLMQGDYMRLGFELAQQTRVRFNELYQHYTLMPSHGFIVVEKSDDDVATFVDVYQHQTLETHQFTVPYKFTNHRIVIVTDAFYFQEGLAKHFQQARYGLFKRGEDGELLLVNLVDEALKIL